MPIAWTAYGVPYEVLWPWHWYFSCASSQRVQRNHFPKSWNFVIIRHSVVEYFAPESRNVRRDVDVLAGYCKFDESRRNSPGRPLHWLQVEAGCFLEKVGGELNWDLTSQQNTIISTAHKRLIMLPREVEMRKNELPTPVAKFEEGKDLWREGNWGKGKGGKGKGGVKKGGERGGVGTTWGKGASWRWVGRAPLETVLNMLNCLQYFVLEL